MHHIAIGRKATPGGPWAGYGREGEIRHCMTGRSGDAGGMEERLRVLEDHIARIALGDRASFEGLYAATSAKLFGVALRVLNDRAEAEEALQDAFLKVWSAADRYRSDGLSPMTWLITIARNTAIDRLRRKQTQDKRHDPAGSDGVIDLLADSAPGPEAEAIASGQRERIATCLGELPEDRADAVRAAYLEGDTYADLASRFGVPLNTMRTWLRRSLLKLRECLTR